MYSDDEMLMLSGIQHFRFCPRQWALIHIEQQWDENRLTMEGSLLHQHADDPFYRQKCGNYITLRSVSVASHQLGLYGVTDVVELHPAEDDDNSISHPQYPGRWLPYPVEYKHGKPKRHEEDEVQLAAQAICLEEQYGIRIDFGAIFYAEIHHRIEVAISDYLRDIVADCASQMHVIFSVGRLPAIHQGKHCERCSLNNICMPNSADCTKVSHYLKKFLYEEAT